MASKPKSVFTVDETGTSVSGRILRLVSRSGWEFVERSNAYGVVAILAITKDDELLLVEQFRHPVNNRTIEIPAGLFGDEDGESDKNPEDAARRELLEETGYVATSMTQLIEIASSPGLTSEKVILFKAENLEQRTSGGGVPGENITIHKVRLETLNGWLEMKKGEGYVMDAKLYSSLYFLSSCFD